MYPRQYCLKTRYSFNKVIQHGNSAHTSHLLIKYLEVSPDVFEDDKGNKKFGIITSNKFNKKAVVQNKARRIIAEAVRLDIDKFPPHWYYVFIPKKTILLNEKVNIHVQDIREEIDTFLSEMALSRSR